jgi:hypothetical protein
MQLWQQMQLWQRLLQDQRMQKVELDEVASACTGLPQDVHSRGDQQGAYLCASWHRIQIGSHKTPSFPASDHDLKGSPSSSAAEGLEPNPTPAKAPRVHRVHLPLLTMDGPHTHLPKPSNLLDDHVHVLVVGGSLPLVVDAHGEGAMAAHARNDPSRRRASPLVANLESPD